MTVRNLTVSTEPGVQAGLSGTLFFARCACTLLIAFAMWGCSSPPATPAPPTPTPVPPPPVTPVPPPVPTRWDISPPSGAPGFVVESRANFTTRADTLMRADTSIAHTALRVVPRGAAIDVTIGAYGITSSYSQPLALTAAARAVGRFDANGAVSFEGPGQSSCTSLTSAAFESTRDLWVKWPATVSIGTQWRDSTTIPTCRDGVPLSVSLVRAYRVTSVSSDTVLRLIEVDRTSRVVVAGNGVLRGDTITISGEGTGTARLRVSPVTGWLFDAAGSSALQLRAVSRARTQTVDQRVEFTAQQRDGR